VSVLQINAFFMRKEIFERFEITDNSPQSLRRDLKHITYMFHGYDGRVLISGNKRLLWHKMKMDEDRLQLLPKILQKFPGNYNKLETFIFGAFSIWIKIRRILRAFVSRRPEQGR